MRTKERGEKGSNVMNNESKLASVLKETDPSGSLHAS